MVSRVIRLQPAFAIQGGYLTMSRLRAAPVRWWGNSGRTLTGHVSGVQQRMEFLRMGWVHASWSKYSRFEPGPDLVSHVAPSDFRVPSRSRLSRPRDLLRDRKGCGARVQENPPVAERELSVREPHGTGKRMGSRRRGCKHFGEWAGST